MGQRVSKPTRRQAPDGQKCRSEMVKSLPAVSGRSRTRLDGLRTLHKVPKLQETVEIPPATVKIGLWVTPFDTVYHLNKVVEAFEWYKGQVYASVHTLNIF